MTTILVYSHPDIREFGFYLIRFVADALYVCFFRSQHISFAFPFITAAQHGNIRSCLLQQLDKILRVWRLACSAYSEVSDAYHRYVKTL